MGQSLVVGHKHALTKIPNPLPSSLVLTGPEGVGKRRAAYMIAAVTGVRSLDFQNLGHLTAEGARAVTEFHSSAPLTSPVRVTVADLTSAHPKAVNSLLKILEEPPPYSRLILHTDREPMLTIRSRCFVVRFGILTEDEVATVLVRQKVPEHLIEDAAKYSQGRVSVALDYVRQFKARRKVENLLFSLREGEAAIESALREALEAEKDEDGTATHMRREVVSRLLERSLRSSLGREDHVASFIPLELRVTALNILADTARPHLRVKAAVWVMSSVSV